MSVDPETAALQPALAQSWRYSPDGQQVTFDLPPDLVAAFQATLEETREATLLLHVIDAQAEDIDDKRQEVLSVLDRIGAGEQPVLEVYNKIDLDPKAADRAIGQMKSALALLRPATAGWRPPVLGVSATKREGIAAFWREVRDRTSEAP